MPNMNIMFWGMNLKMKLLFDGIDGVIWAWPQGWNWISSPHTIQSFFLPVTVRLWNTFIPACILAVFRCTQVKMLIFKNQNDEIDGYVPNVISIYV